MQKIIAVSLAVLLFVSCKETTEKKFTVSGTIANAKAKVIYLERVPAGRNQPVIEDSALLEKDGKFLLKAEIGESSIFNLTLDQNRYPVAMVINDVDKVDVNVVMNKERNEFAEKYDVNGSKASQQMKDFLADFDKDWSGVINNLRAEDSLLKSGVTSDSLSGSMLAERKTLFDRLKNLATEAIKKSNDPALTLFELGYYQSNANQGFGLEAFSIEQVSNILNETYQKFPMHQGLAAIKNSIDKELKKAVASWVGKEAPDFTMPDVNGKEVKLSSFKGKYVLVDFWASWCGPCRQENPNLVKAFHQFKDKNFTVLGVSLDRPGQKDKWLKAINDDKLAWTNISDLQYWNSPVVALYGFEGIPFNVLIDPQGKVIAESLRGRLLEEKLGEVLQ